MSTEVVTRFPPSPTGYLHIGGARTALFNWLFARHHQGRFVLRIEDTDRARSTPEATEAIFEGLRWLGLDWDGDAISQFSRIDRHTEVAHAMLEAGTAYRCYASREEIDAYREKAKAEKLSAAYQSPWRDRGPADWPDGPYTIRLKAPRSGEITVDDMVQGTITWNAETIDDLILMRSDGTPTYMLAVVVDDHDMGITHIIRGDDHLTNAARQQLIFQAMGWDVPVFAHVPLIHGPDGAKMSKRHGATSVTEYRDMGYLPEAMRNYLARLGWSHGDEEFFTDAQAIEWFGLDAIGKAPAKFDFKKLENLNGQHMRVADDARLLDLVGDMLHERNGTMPSPQAMSRLTTLMPSLKERAKTIPEIINMAQFLLVERPIPFDEKAQKQITPESAAILARLTVHLQNASGWSKDAVELSMKGFAETEGIKLGKVAQPVRAALTGQATSPGAFDVMTALGQDETLARIGDVLERNA